MPPQNSAVRNHSLESASLWSLIITLGVAVYAFLPFAATPSSLVKVVALAAGALITLALYILARLSRGNVIFPPALLLGALWLPAIAYILSSAFSGVGFTRALWGSALEPDTLGFVLIATVLGTLSALIVRRTEHFRTLLTAVGYGIAVLVGLQVLVLIVGQFAPNTISPAFSLVGSMESLAFIVGLGIIAALLALRFVDLPARVQKIGMGFGVLALLLLAVANSSVVWVLLALVSLGLFVEAVMRRRSGSMDLDIEDLTVVGESTTQVEGGSRSLVLPLVVLAVSLFFLVGGSLSSALANSLHVGVLNVRPSWQSTLATGHAVYTSSPVFGSGPGTFGSQWLVNRDKGLNSTIFWGVDFTSGVGYLPTSFVTTGVLGALAWLVLMGLFLVYGFRTVIMRSPQDPFMRYVSIVTFVGTLYLFTVAIFTLPSTVLLALLFVSAGLFVSSMRYAQRAGQWGIVFGRSPRLGFVIVFGLTLLLLGSVVAAYGVAERALALSHLARANAALAAGNLDLANANAQKAISFAPTAAAYELQAAIANAHLNIIAASTTMTAADAQQAFQSELSAGINAALTATRLAPKDYQAWVALGNLYAQAVPLKVTGAYDSAKSAYDTAAKLSPTNPQIPYIIAQLAIANKDTVLAQQELKDAIALKQDYTAAIFLLSQLEVQAGNLKDALAAAEAAAYFTPNDPNILFQVGLLRAASNDLPGSVQALSAAIAANAEFANARYFLAAVYAKQGDMSDAEAQLQAIAAYSTENSTAVAPLIANLQAGKDPFPANILSASSTPVQQ